MYYVQMRKAMIVVPSTNINYLKRKRLGSQPGDGMMGVRGMRGQSA